MLLGVMMVLAVAALMYGVSWLNQWADSPLHLSEDRVLAVPAGSSLYRLSLELERMA